MRDARLRSRGSHDESRAGSALNAGGGDLFTARERPDISSTYYGAAFTNLDGHRIEVKTDFAQILDRSFGEARAEGRRYKSIPSKGENMTPGIDAAGGKMISGRAK